MNNCMENIYLIGFMGCGKSTISQYLNRVYKMELIEMDEQIETEQNMKISEIFEQKGEEYFRNLETELIKKLQSKNGVCVSCGGGTAMREVNVEYMKKNGKIVWLMATPETVYDRVKNSHNRPLLEGNMNVEYISSLINARKPKYEKAADITVMTDGKSAAEICKEILKKIEK